MRKNDLYPVLTALFVGALLISNIIAFKLIEVAGFLLPAAVIVFPVVYIVNDVLAEIYGFKKARLAILSGFGVNLMAVIFYNIAIALKSPVWFEGSEAFAIVLSNSLRILIASLSAYLVGTTLNSYVMTKMKRNNPTGGKGLFGRAILSTVFGESVDALIFISIAFIGSMPIESLLIMIASQAAFKILYEIAVFPVTKFVIRKIDLLPA